MPRSPIEPDSVEAAPSGGPHPVASPHRVRRSVAVGLCLAAMAALTLATRSISRSPGVADDPAAMTATGTPTSAAPSATGGLLSRWFDPLGNRPDRGLRDLCLQGLVVSRERPLAIVNQTILGVGDRAAVPLPRRRLAIECLAISMHGVTVSPEEGGSVTLKMSEHSL